MNKLHRLTSLDGIRGLAALGVALFWHYQHFSPNQYPFSAKGYWFYHYGFSLVDLFFILSGIVFCFVYKEKIGQHQITFYQYGVNRFSRLYPLHLITLLIVMLLQSIRIHLDFDFFTYTYNDGYHFLLNLLFIQNGWFIHHFSFNAPSWSIAVEIIAYVLFFYVLFRFKQNSLFVFFLFIIIGLAVNHYNINWFLLNQETDRILVSFFVGCFVFEINQWLKRQYHKNRIIIGVGILFGLVLAATIFWGHKILGDWQMVYALFLFPLGILLVLNIAFLGKLFALPPLKFLGNISYSVYLIHFPIQLALVTINELFGLGFDYSTRLFFFSYLLIVIIISTLSYYFFERPLQFWLRNRLNEKRN